MIRITSNIKQFNARMSKRAKAMPKALDKGLGKWAVMAHREAVDHLLNAPEDAAVGSYPVRTVTGWLRKSEDYILPGRSKHGIQARQGEAYLVNTALYATNIHDDRPFIKDAIENTRSAGREAMVQAMRSVLMDSKLRGIQL